MGLYIRKYPEKIGPLLLEMQQISKLNDKQYLAVVFCTLMASSIYLESLKPMLAQYKEKEHLVHTLEPALMKCGMSRMASRWVLKNLPIVTAQTLKLVDYLYVHDIKNDDEYLNLSVVAELEDDIE